MFLTFLTFLPLLGAVLLTLIPRDEEGAIKQTALAFAVADFVLSIFLWTNFDSTTHEMQFEYSVPWISSWGVSYHVGLDGISLLLYIMTTFLTMISIIASWGVTKNIREYMMSFLALSIDHPISKIYEKNCSYCMWYSLSLMFSSKILV